MSCNFDVEFMEGHPQFPFPQGKSFTVEGMESHLRAMKPCRFRVTKESGYGDGGSYLVVVENGGYSINGHNYDTGKEVYIVAKF